MSNAKATKLAGVMLDYLRSSGDLSLLPEIVGILNRKITNLGLQNAAIVTSSVKLGSAESKAIERFIHSKYGKDIEVMEKIDPTLLAGFTIKVGDEVIDSSLSTKLENIRKELA